MKFRNTLPAKLIVRENNQIPILKASSCRKKIGHNIYNLKAQIKTDAEELLQNKPETRWCTWFTKKNYFLWGSILYSEYVSK